MRQGGGTGIPGGGGGEGGGNNITPQLFYSRRIGLNQNRVIPIDVGGRITGKVGNTSVGVLNIQQADEPDDLIRMTPATNFTVARVKRDILERSSIEAIFTNRSESTVGAGSNQAAGVEGRSAFTRTSMLAPTTRGPRRTVFTATTRAIWGGSHMLPIGAARASST